MDQESDEDNKANLKRVEHEDSAETFESSPDLCEASSESDREVPVPYPSTDESSEVSGLEKVETEGKHVRIKGAVEKGSGDEDAIGDSGSGIGFLKEVLRGEIIGVPLWIWGIVVIALLVVAWVLSADIIPVEPLE